MMKSENTILFRRSGTLNMFFMLENTGETSFYSSGTSLSIREGVASRRRPAVTERRREDLHGTARRPDGSLRGFGERVGLHPDGSGELAPSEDLHQPPFGDQAPLPQAVGSDVVAVESLQ